jgi:hypothetical protein
MCKISIHVHVDFFSIQTKNGAQITLYCFSLLMSRLMVSVLDDKRSYYYRFKEEYSVNSSNNSNTANVIIFFDL